MKLSSQVLNHIKSEVSAPTALLENTEAQYDPFIDVHVATKTISDRIAYGFVKTLRFVADKFFAKRYGHRAVVLETVAAVPGMVGGLLQQLAALRRIQGNEG